MDLRVALGARNWERSIEALRGLSGLPLLDEITAVPSRDPSDASRDGLYHLAEVRHNTVRGSKPWRPISDGVWKDALALRGELVARAKAGETTPRATSRSLMDPGYFVVCPDGTYASVLDDTPVVAEDSTLSLALIDRVEAAVHPLSIDPSFRARLQVPEGRFVPAEPALWNDHDTPALEVCFPEARKTALAFSSKALGDELRASLAELAEGPAPHVAVVFRWVESLLVRTLYFGDFEGPDAPPRFDVVQHMLRRIWAPGPATAALD